MKEYDAKNIRNIGIAGHSGTGKTSLTEALLFTAKAITRLGRTEQGTTTTDYDEDEIKRQGSINSALAFCDWKGVKINIIDTPGESNFFADTQATLNSVDNILIIIDGISGVQVQTQRVWKIAQEYKLPAIFFVNKLEKERADFFKVVEDIKKKFNSGVPFQIPIGTESGFSGLIDLIENKAFRYADDESGKFVEVPVPDDLKEQVKKYRDMLIENIAESNDALLEKYLEKGSLSESEIQSALVQAISDQKISPILCGSAYKNLGSHHLLEIITRFLPSPLFRTKIAGKSANDAIEEREQSESADFSALVFKTLVDQHSGHISLFRVFSGIVNSDSTVFNPNESQKERIGQLYNFIGKNTHAISRIKAGDIGGVSKLKKTFTGNTLCDEKHPITFSMIKFPEPAISFSIKPKSRADEEKMSSAIGKLIEEDPSLKYFWDPQTKETILSGGGQLQIEINVERLRKKFGVDVTLELPHIPYKETIRTKAHAQGKYKRQSGGRGQYGDAWLELEPKGKGRGYEFVNKIVGGVIPRQYIPAVEKGVIAALGEGILAGYPVVDLRVTVYDGSYHEVDSSEMAFKIAASMAFKKAMEQAKPVILEPIMNMEVTVPDECVGDIMGDLNARRGRVMGVEPNGGISVIRAMVPMAEMLRYAPDLKSITGGRGFYHMEFSNYEDVPIQLQTKIIEEAKKNKEEKEEE